MRNYYQNTPQNTTKTDHFVTKPLKKAKIAIINMQRFASKHHKTQKDHHLSLKLRNPLYNQASPQSRILNQQ